MERTEQEGVWKTAERRRDKGQMREEGEESKGERGREERVIKNKK